MCNTPRVVFLCGHVEPAQGIQCTDTNCLAPLIESPSHQICRYCQEVGMGPTFSVLPHASAIDNLLFKRNFDIEMIDPQIYSGIAGIEQRSGYYDMHGNPNYTNYDNFPTELNQSVQELQIFEDMPQTNYSSYPSPMASTIYWNLIKDVYQQPAYEDYASAPRPHNEDINSYNPITAVASSVSCSSTPFGENEGLTDLNSSYTPSTPQRNEKDILSLDDDSGSPLAAKRFDLHELSPTPGTRGHESFRDAASAILDLPLSWRGGGTMREFLEDEEPEYGNDEDEDDDSSDYTVHQSASRIRRIRQPDFLRQEYEDGSPLDQWGASPTGSMVTMSTSDYFKPSHSRSYEEDPTSLNVELTTEEFNSRGRNFAPVNIGPFAPDTPLIMAEN